MPTYRYEMQQESGDLLVGQLAAETAAVAAQLLQERGGRVVKLIPVNVGSSSLLKKIWEI